ncbi:interferon-induced very large GTPase 1-like [Erinaceus europaeus]|uniref:Interferon-induced very large GTPase 1-like n=1 Tax=Erinaceus europaeus TaxID=9365 RepID=A0ABM3W8R2_ERIEU|nr:interferon-induced very large GTPase 1-like [Erinaceus europaeus]
MATAQSIQDELLLKDENMKVLQDLLRKVGLNVQYWLPQLQQQLSITSIQALQHLEEKDFEKLTSQASHPWEKKALEKLFNLSHSKSSADSGESRVEMIKKGHNQVQQALQEERNFPPKRKQRQEKAMRTMKGEPRHVMANPSEYHQLLGKASEKSISHPPRETAQNMKRPHSLTVETLSYRQNLPDRDLLRWASGGLALQGIYKTKYQTGLMKMTEELLTVPEEFSFFGPEQGTRMGSKEFSSPQEEAMFTQTMEKLGFSVTTPDKGSCWGFSLNADLEDNKYLEPSETKKTYSEYTYCCLTKFNYIPLASYHFPFDQLQFSKAALQELKQIEDLLGKNADPDSVPLWRSRTEVFFQRFGSHANQGPLHLGGIFWWKVISEGFQSEQLEEVKQQLAETLEIYIRESYSGYWVNFAEVDASNSFAKIDSHKTNSQNLQAKIQLSVEQTGGPPEANSFCQWKAGLVTSNQTWYVIDRGLQLVPIWDILLSNHRKDFKNPLQVANCLKDSYTALTGLTACSWNGEELLRAKKEVMIFLEDVKSWEVSDPEEQLKKLIDFKQTLSQNSSDIWVNICLTDWGLQNFLVNIVNFCKEASISNIRLIKSQLHSLLDPHVYTLADFPQAHYIVQWISQSESEQQCINNSQYSKLIQSLKETQNEIMEAMATSESLKTMEEAKRKATNVVTSSLRFCLNYYQQTDQPDLQLLLLSIAAGAGYHVVNNTFQYLLGSDELHFLLTEIQTAHDKYQELKNTCSYSAQAFLVLTGLTATAGVTAVSPEEKQQRLTLITFYIGQSLSEEVEYALTRLRMDYDWENLEKDLKLLITGDCEDTTNLLQMNEGEKQLQSISCGKKQPHDNENSMCEVTENTAFLELLQRLGLKHYYPKRMSRANFHMIYNKSVYNTQPSSEQELPFYFLQKLLVLDCGLRYLVFKEDEKAQNQVYPSAQNQENKAVDPYEGFLENIDHSNNPSVIKSRPHIHPMDIQMAILHCADDFARQYILGKLSTCQFALPLLIPSPCCSQIEFSLWSLSQVRRSWQERKKSPQEENTNFKNQQMCCVSAPIVSFIRVGDGFSASKSRIMNCLLSKRKHDIFFHRHCKGSTTDCLLMEGVVEICWFCPSGEEDDRFDSCMIFSNLHGDAKEHAKQLAFLQEVSSLIVVLMSTSDDNEENRKLVRDLWQSSKSLICLLDDKEKNMAANNSDKRVRIGIRNRNEAELIEELTVTARRLLELSPMAPSLEDCARTARRQGFLIDEDQTDCREAKEKAEILITIMGETTVSQMKESLLPLQGRLWHLWCKKDKELYHLKEKGNHSIEQHKSETEEEKQKIRQQQLTRAFPHNDLIRSVLEILQSNSEIHTKLYFLQWLSVLMDNMTAGQLEILNKKKQSLWSQVQTEKLKAIKSNEMNSWQNEIEALSTEITDCTLGVEHILREIGQIYEALEETSSTKDERFHSLPEIAADLMISGVPIELMDGEAAYVPLKWVAAVFDKVSEKLGDKRLFVLSVLGLQSSGKSTLLNALFGLQFTVSAGRCTQGAYMQLLKVEETFTEELGFDFLLVVDTEGLRAPELSSKSQNRDNELATFVIGLGNLTLINIFGENPSEMQDILQIVVQAFLRMKKVKISPSCLFVHQNVGEVTAKEQNMEGRRRLVQRLDEMAATAAEQEQYSDVTCFSDVIKFDANTQVFYFAHLWDGNPPMAPPNPRYSHNIQELKSRILTDKQESRENIMTISEVKLRVQDLWRALISENFIFSFKNTREVMAMSKLEAMYNLWSWKLRSHVLGLYNQLINKIHNGKIQTITTSTLEIPVTEKYEAIKEELEKYFSEDTNRQILVQWKANFESKLINLKEALVFDSKRKADQLISFKNSQENVDSKKAGYEKEILTRSRELAITVKGTKLSEKELHETFNSLWKTWVCDVASTFQPIPEPAIDVDAEDILLKYFNKEKNMGDTLRKYSGQKFQIKYDKHINMNKIYGFFSRQVEVQDKESIDVTTDSIVSRFNETINDILGGKCDYNSSYFHEFLKIIEEEVMSASTHERYTFTNKYKIDLALSLFQIASEKFKEMHKAFKRANDPTNYLESKKNDFFLSFKISCQGATSIKAFVDFLWQKLTPAVSDTMWKRMVLKIAGDMRATCPAFSGNRSNLEKHILIFLAEKENFDYYWQYLYKPESFFNKYIEKQIKRYLSEGSEKMKNFIKIGLEDIKNVTLSAITESTVIARSKSCTVSEWLDLFCGHVESDLIFPRKDLINIDHQEVKDVEFLKEAMVKALGPAMDTVEQNCLSMSVEEMVPEIRKILSEHLSGCWKQCPFCGAICTNTIPNHDGDHSVPFHRPNGIKGWHYHKTDIFTLNICNTSVASDHSFILSDGRKFPYKNYRQAGGEYATWSITPDLSTQPYWKWFVCHFRQDLEEAYKKRFSGLGEIPNSWTIITKQDVIDDLNKM